MALKRLIAECLELDEDELNSVHKFVCTKKDAPSPTELQLKDGLIIGATTAPDGWKLQKFKFNVGIQTSLTAKRTPSEPDAKVCLHVGEFTDNMRFLLRYRDFGTKMKIIKRTSDWTIKGTEARSRANVELLIAYRKIDPTCMHSGFFMDLDSKVIAFVITQTAVHEFTLDDDFSYDEFLSPIEMYADYVKQGRPSIVDAKGILWTHKSYKVEHYNFDLPGCIPFRPL